MQFYKRRQYIVNKAVQWASVIYVFVIVLAILAFHTWLTHWRLSGFINPDARLSLSTTLLVDVMITLAVTGVFAAFAVIFGSHKVAGPIYRCEQTMKRIQKGDLTDFIKLRKGDFLVPFSEEINLAVANLRDIAGEDRIHVQEAIRQLTLVRGAVSHDAAKSLDRVLDTLARIGKKLKIDQDAAKAILHGDVGMTSSQMMRTDPVGKPTEAPVYSAAKTMFLQAPDRRTLKGEQRAPGAGLALSGDATVLPPAGAPTVQPPINAGYAMHGHIPPAPPVGSHAHAAMIANRPVYLDQYGRPIAAPGPNGPGAPPPAPPRG